MKIYQLSDPVVEYVVYEKFSSREDLDCTCRDPEDGLNWECGRYGTNYREHMGKVKWACKSEYESFSKDLIS